MWEQDWALLGIEPTADLVAIKKAYALKLRVTRPDDDAGAYQALRAAYERAQGWAKWKAMAGDEEEDDVPVASAATVEAPVASEPAAEPLPEPVEPMPAVPEVQPEDLVERLDHGYRSGGDAELWALWPRLRAELDAQPLQRSTRFSAEFARWVLRTPQLPNDFVAALNEHFHWLSDFRTERLLGFDLAHALNEELDGRMLRPVGDPRLLALAEPLRQLSDLHARGHRWWSQVLATLLQPQLDQTQKHLGPALLRRLGLDHARQAALQALVRRGAWLRYGLVGLVFTVPCLLLGGGESTFGRVLAWLIGCVVLVIVAAVVGRLLHGEPSLVTPKRRIALPLHAWRKHRSQPWAGLALLLASAAGFYVVADLSGELGDWLPPALWVCAVVGTLLAWPLEAGRSMVMVGLGPLVGPLFTHWALPFWPGPVAVMLGVAWMLVAAAVHEERISAPGVLQWPLRPVLNTLALVDRWGLFVALVPVMAAMAYVSLPATPRDGAGGGMFLSWVFGNLIVGWLQMRADAWALQRLARQPG